MTTPVSQPDAQPQTLNWFGGIMAIGILGLLYLLVYAFVYVKIPTENTSNISQITGAVLLQVGIIIGWFYRSSQEAKKQAETISTLVTSAAAQQAASAPPSTTTTTTKTETTPSAPTTVATVKTPDVEVPLEAGQKATVTAEPKP